MSSAQSPQHPDLPGRQLLSIGDVQAKTGLSSSTLRSWERRVGFPVPVRTAGGQRRYRPEDVERLGRVLEQRRRGLSLASAVEVVTQSHPAGRGHDRSLYAELKARHSELDPVRAPFHVLLALSWALEDECLAHASRPVLFGCFQTQAAFDVAGHRWRELARRAEFAVALSDFPRTDADASPMQVALPPASPMLNEWNLVCLDPAFTVVLAAWEVPRGTSLRGPRQFEAVLSLAPDVVRDAADQLASVALQEGCPDVRPALSTPSAGSGEDAKRSASLLRRFVSYVGAGA